MLHLLHERPRAVGEAGARAQDRVCLLKLHGEIQVWEIFQFTSNCTKKSLKIQRRLHPGPPAETGELQGGLLLVLRLLQGEGDRAGPELRRRDAQVLR